MAGPLERNGHSESIIPHLLSFVKRGGKIIHRTIRLVGNADLRSYSYCYNDMSKGGSYFGPHRKLNRWTKWNYSDFGFYFVTICTKDRIECFGKVEDGIMTLNENGKVAQECWKNICDHFDNAGIDEFIVMPNHIHGIILLMDENVATVGNRHACSLQCDDSQREPNR